SRQLEEASTDIERSVARYGLALAYQANDKQSPRARELIDELFAQDPNRIPYVATKADILTQAGEPHAALNYLERHLRINPDNHPLTMAQADALIAQRDYQTDVEVLERHAQKRPNDHNLWYLIAETQGQAGNVSKVHQARAEYFILVGDFRNAREQLNYALRIERE